MSADTPKPALSLVRSFRASDYKHHEFMPFSDPLDGRERSGAMSMLRGYMQIARLTDYALFESENGINLYLRNDTDLSRFAIARMEDMEIEAYYFTAHPDYSTRGLRYRMKKLQEIAETSGFSGKLYFQVDADKHAIALNADSKKTYFDFLEFAKENELRAKLFKNVPLAPPKEASGPAVMLEIMDQNFDEEDYPPEEYGDEGEIPSNMGFIVGGWNDRMQGPRRSGSLSLVSDFQISDSAYSFVNALDNPQDGAERALVMRKFRGTVENARIKDYKLIERRDEIELYLRTSEDMNRFNVVRQSGDQIEEEFVQFEDGFDFRKIKRLTRHLQSISDLAGFGNKILFGAARNMGGIVILGSPKKAYFEFADYVQANPDKFQKFFDLQRKEPELQIATPTRQNYAEPRIIVESVPAAPLREASERFIRGDITSEVMTPPRGKASMVKSFDVYEYPHVLDMQIGMDFDGPDKLFKNMPDYPEYKTFKKPEEIKNRILGAMEKVGVHDYHVETRYAGLKCNFKSKADWQIATAAIYPHLPLHTEFMDCPRNDSPRKVKKAAKKIQDLFRSIAPGIRFIPDTQQRRVILQADTGTAFIAFAASQEGRIKQYMDFYANAP